MASGFGDHLKREREMRGVSLEEIAGATRISIRFLGALENEAWDLLPGGVFNRGFVRTVARYLGLEEEALLAEYALARGLTPPPAATPSPPASVPASTLSLPFRIFLSAGAAFLFLALLAAGWYTWRWLSARRLDMIAAERALPAPPSPPPAPPALFEPPADAPPAEAAAVSAPAQPAPLQLRISATKPTSIAIISDGQESFAGSIAPGENRVFLAKSIFTVETQDAGAVQLVLNGRPLAPLGSPGQPGKVTLSNPAPPGDLGGHD